MIALLVFCLTLAGCSTIRSTSYVLEAIGQDIRDISDANGTGRQQYYQDYNDRYQVHTVSR
jgi:hypothetical protein